MLNQKKVEIFLVKFRKPPTKQFLEVAYIFYTYLNYICQLNTKISVVSLSQSKIYR